MIGAINKLTVMHNSTQVGVLRHDYAKGCCVFEYLPEWLKSGFSLSPFELPLKAGLFFANPQKFNGNFATFEDSLPDGYGLYLLDRMLRKQGHSLEGLTPLQRLSIVGKMGMGALRYIPTVHLESDSVRVHEDLLDSLQQKALEVLSERNAADESLLYYVSGNSGGARPKTLMLDENGVHWIVKFRHNSDASNAGREEFKYMSLAGKCGIQIPRIKLIKDKYFAIERFDIEHGKPIHMLSAAAMLQTNFRHNAVDYTNLLTITGVLTQDPLQVEQMFRRMVFNVVCDNKDDHAKNFTFLCRDGVWSLAPAYDLTHSPGGINGQHATSLFFDGNPSDALMIKAGVQMKIPKSRCEDIIAEIREARSRL